MSLLGTIVKSTRRRVAERRTKMSLAALRARAADQAPVRSLHDALSRGFGVIGEHKRRSPSRGAMDARNLAAALATYETTPWIVAVSVLTDLDHFDGSLEDLSVARARVGKPILRKDFIVDEYQVVEARAFGADAILLMASVHASEPSKLRELYDLARSLGLDVLVELGMGEYPIEELVGVVPPEARIWGINSRNFRSAPTAEARAGTNVPRERDPSTDARTHRTYRRLIPDGKIAVAESGIHGADDLVALRADGYHGALIGTAFLQGPAPISAIVTKFARAFPGPGAP